MKKYVGIAFIFGLSFGYLTFIVLDEISKNNNTQAEHEIHHSEMPHDHKKTNVTSPLIPILDVEVFTDSKSGYNVHLLTQNYLFTPELANMSIIENQGHAHIYINGEKVARVYGEWFHIDEHHLVDGINTLRVTLNANDHSEWSINNNPIEFITKLN